MSPAGMGLSMASWTAYMTMKGVLKASVSAGSSQRAARVTWSAHRISRRGLAALGPGGEGEEGGTQQQCEGQGKARASTIARG
jgi:hypothetical protein